MNDHYDVVEVRPEWRDADEDMGSKEKFWYRQPGEEELPWLFKYPRGNMGEHWAEKVASEVAGILGIPHARVELAEFEGVRGSATESFAVQGMELRHGNVVLQGALPIPDDRVLNFHAAGHTLENIWKAFENVFVGTEDALTAKRMFVRYLVMDAVIGNVDRHSENWGLLQRYRCNRLEVILAPSYDHGSSLGKELTDARRDLLLAEQRVGRYSERGRGKIFRSESDSHGASPVELARVARSQYPKLFAVAVEDLKLLRSDKLEAIFDRIPTGWVSEASRKFAVELMTYNCQELNLLQREVMR